MKTLIIGLGNPILKDDGVGIRIAELVRQLISGHSDVEVKELSVGGLRLMEEMAGYDRVLLVDAVMTGACEPGTIHRLNLDDLEMSLNSSSTHDTNLACALESGRKIGMKLPAEVVIFGVETSDVNSFGEELTEAVEAAVPLAVKEVLTELGL